MRRPAGLGLRTTAPSAPAMERLPRAPSTHPNVESCRPDASWFVGSATSLGGLLRDMHLEDGARDSLPDAVVLDDLEFDLDPEHGRHGNGIVQVSHGVLHILKDLAPARRIAHITL